MTTTMMMTMTTTTTMMMMMMRAVEKSLAQNRLVYPDEEVLHQARLAIVRLQAAYNLTATRLLASASANITARDAASLAHEAFYIGFPLVAEGWQRLGSAVPGQVSGCWLSWSGQWLAMSGVGSSWSGQWLAISGEGSSWSGQWLAISGEGSSWSGQWLAMSGVGSSWSDQWLAVSRVGSSWSGQWLAMSGVGSSWSSQWLAMSGVGSSGSGQSLSHGPSVYEARYAGDVLFFARSATVAWPVCAERSRTLGFLSLDMATTCCEAHCTEDIIPGQVCRCTTASLSCEVHCTEDIIPGQVCRCNTASLGCEAHNTGCFIPGQVCRCNTASLSCEGPQHRDLLFLAKYACVPRPV